MSKMLAAAAVLALFTGGAAMAADCSPGSTSATTNGSPTANANTTPALPTCEVLVQPNGTTSVQNGPASNAAGTGPASNHEAGGTTGAPGSTK